ncbi:hypothetical protein ZWY2020_040094 [Hordeum vulgare]|nr:hypothetical protein ZWY2020_040094 [Hordeum vulgare]
MPASQYPHVAALPASPSPPGCTDAMPVMPASRRPARISRLRPAQLRAPRGSGLRNTTPSSLPMRRSRVCLLCVVCCSTPTPTPARGLATPTAACRCYHAHPARSRDFALHLFSTSGGGPAADLLLPRGPTLVCLRLRHPPRAQARASRHGSPRSTGQRARAAAGHRTSCTGSASQPCAS